MLLILVYFIVFAILILNYVFDKGNDPGFSLIAFCSFGTIVLGVIFALLGTYNNSDKYTETEVNNQTIYFDGDRYTFEFEGETQDPPSHTVEIELVNDASDSSIERTTYPWGLSPYLINVPSGNSWVIKLKEDELAYG